jgi:GAF domain-containing protein
MWLNENVNAYIQNVRAEVEKCASSARTMHDLMEAIVGVLHRHVPTYNWVGFYLLSDDGKTLELGPFRGAVTPHTRIPLDQGICGAAISSGKTVVVDDVNSDPRYLACSVETKSEMVVPIYRHARVVGELDIDSHTRAAFTNEDRELVEYCAAMVTGFLEANAA